MEAKTIDDVRDLIATIDEHVADDERQLAAVLRQADAVYGAYDDLMSRLRREIEAASGAADGVRYLRG